MAHENDSISKALFQWRPAQYVQRFMPGATFLHIVPTELIREPLRADGLFRVRYPEQNNREAVLHLEAQTRMEDGLEERCCLYNLLTRQRERVPVYTKILFLEETKLPSTPWVYAGTEDTWILQFSFEIIALWTIPVEDWLQAHLEGLLPFTPFLRGAKVAILDDVYQALQLISDPFERANSLLYTLVFARRRFDARAVNMFIRRHPVLQKVVEESPLYQEIIQLGEERGLKLGEERGLKLGEERGEERGKIEGLRVAIVDLCGAKAPEMAETLSAHIRQITDPVRLRQILLGISQAQTPEELRLLIDHLD